MLVSATSRFFCGFFSTAVTIPLTFSYTSHTLAALTSRFALCCRLSRPSLYFWYSFIVSWGLLCFYSSRHCAVSTTAPNTSNSYFRFSFPVNAVFAMHHKKSLSPQNARISS